MALIGLWRRFGGPELMAAGNEFGYVKELVPSLNKDPSVFINDYVHPRVKAISEAIGGRIDFTPRTPYGHMLGGANGKTLVFDTFTPLYKKYPKFATNLAKSLVKLAESNFIDNLRLYLGSPNATLEPITQRSITHALAPLILFPNQRMRIALDAEGNKKSTAAQLVLIVADKYNVGVDAEPGPSADSPWSQNPNCSCLIMFKTFRDLEAGNFPSSYNYDVNAKCHKRILVNNQEECDVPLLARWYNRGFIQGVDFPLDTHIDTILNFKALVSAATS